MGSAQSARRIQPGGGSGRAGGPADLSRSPFLPTPPPALPPPLASPPASPRAGGGGGVAGVGGRGRGWGRRGTAPRPATGRRRAHFHRGGAPRPAPGRLGRPAGKVARGGPVVVVVVVVIVVVVVAVVVVVVSSAAGGGWRRRRRRWRRLAAAAAGPPLPECYSPPAAGLAESRGRGSQTRRRALPPPGAHPRGGLSREGAFPAGARRCPPGGAGPPLPRRDRSPTPAPPPTGWVGAGRTVPSAPRAGRAVGPGGCLVWGAGAGSCLSPAPPVQGPRRRAKRAHGVSGDVGHPPDPS